MSARVSVEALSVAAFTTALLEMPHNTRATVTATENGTPWATVTISPLTGFRRSVFPNFLGSSAVGDTRKRGQSGVHFAESDARHALGVVIERARRMAVQYH